MFKKFVLLVTCFLILFGLYHLTIWHFFTSKVYDRDDGKYVGDLGRVSYQLSSLHPRNIEFNLEKKHFNASNWNEEKIDMVTVGDSFSNADTGGLNPYYQDYIASIYDINVLNLKRISSELNSFELIIALYNSGWLQKYKPKYVLLQSVQRFSLNVHAIDFDWDITLPPEISILADQKTTNTAIPKPSIINTANYNFLKYSFLYNFTQNGYKKIPKLNLSKQFFSPAGFESFLLITHEDIKNLSPQNDTRVQKLNNNLNKLANLLSNLDIALIYMPAVDKYDLYYDFIINNPYPKNFYFDLLRREDKQYIFIDTKEILQQKLYLGEIDIFYADDTHWSYKASESIVNSSTFKELFYE